ncbi:MAG: acetylornithine/succinylornithine family transaminase, partial [Ignavibacteriae bacterium]|nr:acetylornithine/succinylornithine family transaminase [Ignavibacteriota bacterium]
NKSYQVNTYSRYNVEFVRGDGVYLFDKAGNKYLDLLSGISVTGLGHKNKKLINAAVNQIDNLWHTSNLFTSTPQEQLAKKLCEKSGLSKVFFCNSGTEANEAAIKFARKFGKGKSTIITTDGSFHGRTYGSLSASAQEKLWEGFQPLTPGFQHTPYNNIESIKNAIDETTIAIMVEPIQGENGIVIPSHNYLNEIRNLCDEKNLLMIIDEIQTGYGRTGKFFAYQHNNILPDIVTSAKGIANGLPLGAVICSEKVAEAITPGSHGSTFGGNPISIVVANKVIELITPEVLEYINSIGLKLAEKIKSEQIIEIEEIRNKGLMFGLKINSNIDVKLLAKSFLDEKIVVGTAGNNVLRLLPPYVIDVKNIDHFVYILKDLFKKMNISTKAS